MDTISESNIQPPPPLSEHEHFQQYFVNPYVNSLIAANHVINTIIDKGSRILYGKYLKSRMPEHYGEFFGTAMEELTHQEVAAYDPGESVDSYVINWGEEDEPETAPVDSWCPVWVKMAQPHAGTKTHSLNSLSSVADSLQSGKNRSKKKLSIINSQQNLKKSGDFRGGKGSVEIEEDEPKFYKIPGMEKPYDDDKESEELRREREEQRKLKLLEAQEKKQQQIIEKEKEDKKKKTENQLKNKEYTFDYAGNPVFLTRSVKVNKLPNNETVIPKFDLNVDLKVVKGLPEDPPVRENKKDEDEDKNKISLSFIHNRDEYDDGSGIGNQNKKKEGAQYLLPVTGNINEILNVRPGVRMTIDELVREGPEYQKTDKMRRDQYLKSLDERRQERLGYYKRIMENPLVVDGVINEDEEHPEVMKNKLLAIQLRKLGDLGGLMEIEIHEQEQFIQMLLEDAVADPKALLEQMRRKERAQKKLEEEHEAQEEAKRANIIENRVSNYQTPKSIKEVIEELILKISIERVSGLPPIEGSGKKTTDRPATTKASTKPTNIQKAFDAYNRQLLDKEWEDKNNLKPAVVGTIAQKISPDKKAAQKAAIFGGQIPKEPRERATVGQKKLLEIIAPTFPSPKSGMNDTQTPKDKIKTIFQSPTSKDVLLSAKRSPGYKLDSGKKEKGQDENSQSKTKILVRPTTLVGDKPSSSSVNKALANKSVEVRGSKK